METRHVDSNREGAESMTEQDTIEMRRRVRAILNVLAFAHVRAEDMGASAETLEDAPLEMALLDQLRQAVVEQGAEHGQGPSSSGSRSPLDVAALDLWTAVGRSAAETATAVGVPVGRSPSETMRAVLPQLAHASLPVLVWIGEEWSEWASKIQEYLQPTRRTPLDRACPVCGQQVRQCRDEFGAPVQKPCLVAVWDVEGEQVQRVECSACSAIWPRAFLWNLLSADEEEETLVRLSSGG